MKPGQDDDDEDDEDANPSTDDDGMFLSPLLLSYFLLPSSLHIHSRSTSSYPNRIKRNVADWIEDVVEGDSAVIAGGDDEDDDDEEK